MQRPRCSMKLPKMRRSMGPSRRAGSITMRAMALYYNLDTSIPRSRAMSERGVSRREILTGAVAAGAAAVLPAGARRAAAQAKPTITYWNGLTGADGKIMDELIQ